MHALFGPRVTAKIKSADVLRANEYAKGWRRHSSGKFRDEHLADLINI